VDTLDLLILAGLLVAILRGARRGFIGTAPAWLGTLVGIAAGDLLAGRLIRATDPSPLRRLVLGAVLLALGGAVGSLLGGELGARLRSLLRPASIRGLDSAAGGLLGGSGLLALAWLLGLVFASGPFPGLAAQIQGSAVLQALDTVAPTPPAALDALRRVLAGLGSPQVFVQLGPPPGAAIRVSPDLAALPSVQSAAAETVRVTAVGCGAVVESSGFPVGAHLVVTNAHVVAGSFHVCVALAGGFPRRGSVVLFDPATDLALVSVPRLTLTPLPLHLADLPSGSDGAVAGYPEGGPLTVVPAGVRGRVLAQGRDIYGSALVTRPIYDLQATVRPGDSGGPFLDTSGEVAGVVFATSAFDPSQGYALTTQAVVPDIQTAVASPGAVPTGPCPQ
jgi:S1-C subfamily serine protease